MCFSQSPPAVFPAGNVIGPKTGSNRAQNTTNMLSDVFFFLGFFNIVMGFMGFLIIPKWLVNDS